MVGTKQTLAFKNITTAIELIISGLARFKPKKVKNHYDLYNYTEVQCIYLNE